MSEFGHIKDPARETRLFSRRVLFAALIALLALGGLVSRMVYLQVIEHRHFTTLSEGNRVRIEPVAPTRGLIYDRNGVLLAENRPTYQLEITPEQVDDMQGTLQRLSELIDVRPADLERFNRLLKTERRFQPIPLRTDLSAEEVARFSVNRYAFPGVDIKARLSRYYPYGKDTAHVVGYVGSISESELQAVDAARYAGTNVFGKTGIERTYESILHGEPGYQQLETNAQGRTVRVLDRKPPVPGKDLYLNLDIRMQQAAEAALGDYKGAVVAVEPQSGAVVALVSKPSFDANLFVNGIDQKTYDELRKDKRQPLFNRFLNGHYPPGSTIKPFLGLAGLADNVAFARHSTFCSGEFFLEGNPRPYRCWKRYGHGLIDLHNAIEQSCDVYFYQLALELGIDRIHDFLDHFGFGKKTGIDLTGEFSGLLPSREWKRRTRGQPWYPGETVITGIGQGFMLATPLQLGQATALIAAHGRGGRLTLLKGTEDRITRAYAPAQDRPYPVIDAGREQYWNQIVSAMVDVVNGPHGTARAVGYQTKYTMAGKSGTAQVFSLARGEEYDESQVPEELRDHGLFIAFAPAQDPKLAVAVVVENGGGGSHVAAPVAKQVLDAYLLHDAEDAHVQP